MPTVKIGALLTQWIAVLIGGAIIFFSFKDRWSGRRVFLDLGCSTNIHLSES